MTPLTSYLDAFIVLWHWCLCDNVFTFCRTSCLWTRPMRSRSSTCLRTSWTWPRLMQRLFQQWRSPRYHSSTHSNSAFFRLLAILNLKHCFFFSACAVWKLTSVVCWWVRWTCSGFRCWLRAGPLLWTASWGRESSYSVFTSTVCSMVNA